MRELRKVKCLKCGGLTRTTSESMVTCRTCKVHGRFEKYFVELTEEEKCQVQMQQ